MDDWFSDPFFKPERPSPADIQSHFEEVHRHMNTMVQSMFNTFQEFSRQMALPPSQSQPLPALEDHSSTRASTQPRRATTRPIVQEPPPSGSSRAPTRPIVQEPPSGSDRSRNPPGQPYFYTSAMTACAGPDGLAHARRKTYDSATGKTELAEMRRLGDQALAVRREIGPDGAIKDEVDRKNLDEADVPSFRQRWDGKRSELPKLGTSMFPALTASGGSGGAGRTQPARRALK